MWHRQDWRLLGEGIASIPSAAWGKTAGVAIPSALTTVFGATKTDGAVAMLFGVVGCIALLVGFLALAIWVWTGPVFAPLRADRERKRIAAELQSSPARRDYDVLSVNWQEFCRASAPMFTAFSREQDRLAKGGEGASYGPELIQAARVARVAAEAICLRWRQEAVDLTTPLAELSEPVDFETVRRPLERLQDFLQACGQELRRLADKAGVTAEEFAGRART